MRDQESPLIKIAVKTSIVLGFAAAIAAGVILCSLLSGCADYNSLSRGRDGGVDDAGAPDTDGALPKLSAPDFAGADLAGADLTGIVAPEEDMATVADGATSPADLAGADLAKPCVSSLANVGAGDFSIRFTVSANSGQATQVRAQRKTCDNLSAEGFWDIQIKSVSGQLSVETGDPAHYTPLVSTVAVADGSPHDVIVARVSGALSIYVDGALSVAASSTSVLGSLPALGYGPCFQAGGTTAVSNFCMTK